MRQLRGILKSKKKFILCFSIIVTGRCNANCSYCHFFGTRNRSDVSYDITDELFDIYAFFISKAKKVLPSNFEVQSRFSGGEPLILGNRIFELAKRVYTVTGIRPYILTNGKEINSDFVNSAKKSYISHLCVSLENPLDPDKGAPNPIKIIDKIKRYNSDGFPIIPAVTVIANKHFRNLYKICRIFYEKLRCLPVISEISVNSFVPPTRKQLEDLYKNVFKVVKYFHLRTAVKLFPDISPELYFGEYGHCVFHLGLENTHKLTKSIIKTKLVTILNQLNENYRDSNCKNKNCEWFEDCKRVIWIWKEGFGKITPEEKMKSYCDMKRTINTAFLKALESF